MPLPYRWGRSPLAVICAYDALPIGIRIRDSLPGAVRTGVLWHVLLTACLVACSRPGWGDDTASTPLERRPDAAEAVQEGNVEQWLQHYQRERAAEWERARAGAPDDADARSPKSDDRERAPTRE